MNPIQAWNVFWFRPVSARPLAAFRVVMGFLTLAHLGLLMCDVDHWLTDHGLLQGTESRDFAGVWSKISVINGVFLRERLRYHCQVCSAGARNSGESEPIG